jgi:hypothetical protein
VFNALQRPVQGANKACLSAKQAKVNKTIDVKKKRTLASPNLLNNRK